MQITKFDLSCQSIEKVCSRLEYTLQWQKTFKPLERKIFDQALKSLEHLLYQDFFICFKNLLPLRDIAYRIVRLDVICNKIKRISNLICQSNGPKYFCYKMNQDIIPSLINRIHDLNLLILSTHRLPFAGEDVWSYFLYEMNNQIRILEIANIHALEKEFFHLIGNGLRGDLLSPVHFSSLSGNVEIKAFLSWIHVLNFAIRREKNESTKKIFEFLLVALNEAVPLAVKQSYFICCYTEAIFQNDFSVNSYPDTTYYESVAALHSHDQALLYPLRRMNQQLFAQQYDLSTCRVPLKVIENNMAWDMVNTVSCMEKGEVRIFSLGVVGHRVLVQLTCEEKDSSTQNSQFRYTIFNTGNGVLFHLTAGHNGSLLVAYPLTFHYIPGRCLDYFFCSKLFKMCLLETDINVFYEFHISYLHYIVGAIPDFNYGKWYPLQKYGTCTHSSLEAWISSYLNPTQIKDLEILKTEILVAKQAQMIDLIRTANQSLNGAIRVKNSFSNPLSNKNWIVIDLSQKLQESQLLLHLGLVYLHDLKMLTHISHKILKKSGETLCEMHRECARDHYQVDKTRVIRDEDRMTGRLNFSKVRK